LEKEISSIKLAIYPGTFDPITLGHLDILTRSLKLFDRVILAVLGNSSKEPLFSLSERVAIARKALRNVPNITVESFDGLVVDFLKQKRAQTIIRGMRVASDFEYEFQMALMNRRLMPDFESVFLVPSTEFIFLSSSLVKEVAARGGSIKQFVPDPSYQALRQKFHR
jgi:pantetheine-phosphate adenylyltransferase